MICRRVSAGAEERHKSIAEIFVDHTAVLLLDHAHSYAQKVIEHFQHVMWRARPGSRRERANIDKHHRDFLFDSTQSRIARQDLFSRSLPHMETECLSQPLLVFELA